MSPSEYDAPSPELRQELEQRVARAIESELHHKFRAMKQRRNGTVAEVLKRLDIGLPEPSKIEGDPVALAPLMPKYTVRDGQMYGPVYWVYASPYLPVENKYCDGNPNQCEAISTPEVSELNIALHMTGNSADAWGFAGLGAWWVPRTQSPVLVSFNTLLDWSWDYELVVGTEGQTAHSRAEVGARVFSWNAQGEDQQQLSDTTGLWDYGVDGWDWHHKDDGNGQANSYVRFQPTPGRSYFGCSYIFGACDAGPSAQATVDILGRTHLIITEEWTSNPPGR
jgi:hypothetical protein